jgi:hypothetical protein
MRYVAAAATFGALVVPVAARVEPAHAAAPPSCLAAPLATANEYQTFSNARSTTNGAGDMWDIVALPDGRNVFLFGDTGWYAVKRDGSAGPHVGVAANSGWLQTRGCLARLAAPGPPSDRQWIKHPATADRYWATSGVVVNRTRLHVFLAKKGPPRGDFGNIVGRAVATVSLPSLRVERVDTVPASADGPAWGASSVLHEGYVYVYGTKRHGTCFYCLAWDVFLMRVPSKKVVDATAYRYWDGTSWSTDEADAAPVVEDDAGHFQVKPYRGGFVAFTKVGEIISPTIDAWWSATPVGPWQKLGPIYTVPTPKPWNKITYSNRVYTYLAVVAPWIQLADGGVLAAYNVNAISGGGELQRDALLYGPRFTSVQIPTVAGMTPVDPPAPPPDGLRMLHIDGRVQSHGAPRVAWPKIGNTWALSYSAARDTDGGYVATVNGKVYPVGTGVQVAGSMAGRSRQPIVGIAATPTGRGYALLGANGAVYTFGDAKYRGGLASTWHAPVASIEMTPTGRGYVVLTRDGAVYAFGDAHFYGSAQPQTRNTTAVDIALRHDGHGYWVVTSNGRVASFGAAGAYGGLDSYARSNPVVAIVPTDAGDGYRLVDRAGNVHVFGAARAVGSGAYAGRDDIVAAG